MSHSVSIRLPRISPTTALQYEGFTIPPGVGHSCFALICRFELEIYQTTLESIRITRDLMIGLPDEDALRVNARVTGVI